MIQTGTDMIIAERARQITREGYSTEHDDFHDTGNLWRAAVAYISGNKYWWPWEREHFKPESDEEENPTTHDLVRAGALIAAELDRRQRLDNQ